jgi:hypothetical protein
MRPCLDREAQARHRFLHGDASCGLVIPPILLRIHPVTIPVLPELAEIIVGGPIGELSTIASKKGQPIRKEVPERYSRTSRISARILTKR